MNFAWMAVEISRDDLADLGEAGGGRNAEVLEAFEYPKADAWVESLRLAHSL